MIQSKRDQFVIPQRDIRLQNIFLKKDVGYDNFCINTERPDFRSVEVICIAANELGIDEVEKLAKLSKSGKRIYILLGDKNNTSNQLAIKHLAGQCLIRTGVTQSGSVILTNPNTADKMAWICASEKLFSEDSSAVKTNQKTVDWLFQTFCYLFWKRATHEFFSQDKEPREIRPETNPVMDIFTDKLYCKPNMLYESILADLECAFSLDIVTSIHNTHWIHEILPENKKCQNICFLLSYDDDYDNPDITELCNKTSNGFIAELSNEEIHNSIIKNTNVAYLIPNYPIKEGVNWSCVDEDTKYTINYYPHNWELKKSEDIGNLQVNDKIRFADDPDVIYNMKVRSEIPLGKINATTIDEFCKDPRKLCEEKGLIQFDRDRLAYDISYSIEIHPPYLPKNAKRECLGWDIFQKQWTKNLENLDSRINKHIKEKSNWKKSVIARIQGKEQKLVECQKNISRLRSVTFHDKSPGSRKQYESDYHELCKNIDDLISESLDEKILVDMEENWKNKEQEIIQNRNKKNEQLKNEKDEKKISKLNKDMERLAEDLARHQKNKPKRGIETSTDDFGKILKTTDNDRKDTSFPPYPNEELPSSGIGILFSNERGRYLTIDSLDNLEKSKSEAARLHAKICVKEN